MTGFTKMEGLGNDFLVLEGPIEVNADEIARWTHRQRGVGADGVLVVWNLGDDRIRMEVFNADGSPAELSGNGLRCAARFSLDRGWAGSDRCRLETVTGSHRVERLGPADFRVELGRVQLGEQIQRAGRSVHTASIGNPHAVLVVEDPEVEDVAEQGPRLAADFPGGVNVGFLGIESRRLLRLRVWERGVGETLACGTGAAAAHAVAFDLGLAEPSVSVALHGGDLDVQLVDGVSWIRGPAHYVFEGTWSPR